MATGHPTIQQFINSGFVRVNGVTATAKTPLREGDEVHLWMPPPDPLPYLKPEEMELDVLAFGAETLQNLCLPENMPKEHLGQMTSNRWQQLRDQLIEIELIDETVDADSAFLQ